MAGEGHFLEEGAKWCRVQDLLPMGSVLRSLGVRDAAVSRGTLFEGMIVHALHARYLIVSWRLEKEWVPLKDVLAGAVSEADGAKLQDIKVNASQGVCRPDDPTGGTAAQARGVTWYAPRIAASPDAYLWCRREDGGEYPMAVHLRRKGETSEPCDPKPRKRKGGVVGLLIQQQAQVLADAVGMVPVDASALSIGDWLWA
jgi:hypothetical protein